MQHPLHKEHKNRAILSLQVLHQFFMLDLVYSSTVYIIIVDKPESEA